MKHYLLTYHYVDDYLERRGALRPAHFAHCQQAVARDFLVLGGAILEGEAQGVLLFATDDRREIHAFAEADPYVQQGLVKNWDVREWITVIALRP